MPKTKTKAMAYHAIGTWVAVNAIAEVRSPDSSNHNKRRVCEWPLTTPLFGQIVGVTYLYGGTKVESRGGYDEWEPGYLDDRYAVLVYQVRLGMRSKPIHVVPASLEPLAGDHGLTLPWASPTSATPAYGRCAAGAAVAREIPRE